MKRVFLAIATLAAGFAVSTPALADLQLATAKNCMACHAAEKKLVGPSFKDGFSSAQLKSPAHDGLFCARRPGCLQVFSQLIQNRRVLKS